MEQDTQRDSTVRFTFLRSVAVLTKRSEMGTRGGRGEGYDRGTSGREIGGGGTKGVKDDCCFAPKKNSCTAIQIFVKQRMFSGTKTK